MNSLNCFHSSICINALCQERRQGQNNWALKTSGSQRFAVRGALRLFLIGTEKIPLNNVPAVKMQRGLADLWLLSDFGGSLSKWQEVYNLHHSHKIFNLSPSLGIKLN